MKKIIFAILILSMLAACKQPGAEEIAITSPFIGGTQGLDISFQDFRTEVFDGGEDPFDVIVQVENKGEAPVLKQNAIVKISGINPVEFGKTDASALKTTVPDNIIETRKTPEGQIMESPPLFVEFTELNHIGKIAGATATFPLRAEVCYTYKTTAVSQLCIREKLLAPETGGICEVTGSKPVFCSGAPVQITNLQQVVRSKDKIGFSFDISNVGGGYIYERGSDCDKSTRAKENKVFIIIDTGLPAAGQAVQCTGLQGTGTGAQGYVTLYGGSKTISCTQQAESTADFKQLITITAEYEYEQMTETTLAVKSSGVSE